jgi:hypothetical protein
MMNRSRSTTKFGYVLENRGRGSLDDEAPGTRQSGSGRYEGSGVGMAGMAERYWKELRPSSAGRFRLGAPIPHDQEPTGRPLRRPRPHPRPKLRTTSR